MKLHLQTTHAPNSKRTVIYYAHYSYCFYSYSEKNGAGAELKTNMVSIFQGDASRLKGHRRASDTHQTSSSSSKCRSNKSM